MKKTISLILAVTCLVLNVVTLSSCEKKKQERFSAHSFDYFDTATTIIGYTDSQQEFDEIRGKIERQLQEYHKLYTIYNSYEGVNNLCALNKVKNGSHEKLVVDKKIIDLLNYSKEMYEVTDGNVNIAMGSVLSIWHKHRNYGLNNPDKAELPPIDELKEAQKHMGIDAIVIDEKESTVFISDPQATIDVGAIAKGYAVERIIESLVADGITGVLLNVGGNVRSIPREDGEKWRVGIENPDKTSAQAYIKEIAIDNKSVVTSGSYQRFYTVNGKNYHHIIDKETLMPCEKFSSVTIVCEKSDLADAYSTALFIMDYEEGRALAEKTDGVEAMWVFPDGTIKTTENFQ